MAKMKIYEIARSIQQQDKNIKSGDLVTLLNENGFEVKGANSNIEDEAIGFLMNYFKKKKAAAKAEPKEKVKAPVKEEPKVEKKEEPKVEKKVEEKKEEPKVEKKPEEKKPEEKKPEEKKSVEKKPEEKKDTSSSDKKDNTVDIKVDTTITVVDKNKADELANKGEVVWKDNNETVPKTDGTAVEEKVETPSSTEEKPAETTGTADTKQPEKETSKQDTKPAASANQGAQESKPSKQTHTHNYNIPITKTVHHDPTGHYEPVYKTVTDYQDQPVYEYRTICNKCGADCTNDPVLHSAECGGGYSNKKIQTGTQRVAVGTHQEQTETRWVQDSAAWDETVTTGYKCSCGATK